VNAIRAISIVAVGVLTATCSSSEPPLPTMPAVQYIASAFKNHQLVALSELHGSPETFALFKSIVSDPAFQAAGADVVVEFGNARHQDVADRYVGGEEVAREDLERIWLDTTQISGIWGLPMYESMLTAVRNANVALPPARRIRVWLGDPPIDWTRVVSPADEDMNDWRDAHFARVVEDKVRKPGRKALLFVGGAHITRRVIFPNSLIHLLDLNPAPPALVVCVVDIDVAAPAIAKRMLEWPERSAVSVRNTWLGRTDVKDVGSKFSRGKLEEDVDAVVLLSHSGLTYLPPPHVNSASAYGLELARRRRIAAATVAFRGGAVRFVQGDAPLTPESEPPLGEILAELGRDRGLELVVKAYADERERDVMALTTRRAATVVQWLVGRGVSADRLSTRACGVSRPLFFGVTEEERARNRRADLVRRTPDISCHPPW
jgi:outer membrane protein OmpA-like peptidoglycan-associated protein